MLALKLCNVCVLPNCWSYGWNIVITKQACVSGMHVHTYTPEFSGRHGIFEYSKCPVTKNLSAGSHSLWLAHVMGVEKYRLYESLRTYSTARRACYANVEQTRCRSVAMFSTTLCADLTVPELPFVWRQPREPRRAWPSCTAVHSRYYRWLSMNHCPYGGANMISKHREATRAARVTQYS